MASIWSERTQCAVGHRVVHGGRSFYQPTLIDQHVVDEIFRLAPLARCTTGQPRRDRGSARPAARRPRRLAVFDTGFFHGLPDEAALYAIDRQVTEEHALRRYGFHGTSHDYVPIAPRSSSDVPTTR